MSNVLSFRSLAGKLREHDKRQHFWVCFLLQALFLPWLSILLSVLLALLIGTGKECWDQLYGSGFCWYDMLANVLGIIVGVTVFMALQLCGLPLFQAGVWPA